MKPVPFGSVIQRRPNVEPRRFLLAGRGGDRCARRSSTRSSSSSSSACTSRPPWATASAGSRRSLRARRHQWMAWKRQQGLSSSMAMRRYTELAASTLPGRSYSWELEPVTEPPAKRSHARGADRSQQHEREQREQKQQQQQQQRRRARPCVSPRSRRGQQRKQREQRRRRRARPRPRPRSARGRRRAAAAATATRAPPPTTPPAAPTPPRAAAAARPSGRPPGSRSRWTTRSCSTSSHFRRRLGPRSPRGGTSGASVPPAALAAGARPNSTMTDVSPPPKPSAVRAKRCPGWNCPRRSRR